MKITSNGMSHTRKHLATMWQQAKAYQIKMAHTRRTHQLATSCVARSSSKSQLKFLFDLANVSDSAGSRRHRWTRDRQPHWRTLSMRERALYIYMCVRVCVVCLCVCLPLETAPRSCRPTWTPTMLTKCQQQQQQQHQGGQTGDTRQLKIGYR